MDTHATENAKAAMLSFFCEINTDALTWDI